MSSCTSEGTITWEMGNTVRLFSPAQSLAALGPLPQFCLPHFNGVELWLDILSEGMNFLLLCKVQWAFSDPQAGCNCPADALWSISMLLLAWLISQHWNRRLLWRRQECQEENNKALFILPRRGEKREERARRHHLLSPFLRSNYWSLWGFLIEYLSYKQEQDL